MVTMWKSLKRWPILLALLVAIGALVSKKPESGAMQTFGRMIAWSAAWAWFFLASVGGLALLIHQGPLPITNGWFAMFSGIGACPLTASLLRRYFGLPVSRRDQFMVALLILIAGRIAVVIVLHRPFLPQ
jgi:hypothetical protein